MTQTISPAQLNDCLPALNRFAMTLTRNEDRAGDLVQDTVERALRKVHLFDGSNLRSWLFTICRRVFLNQIRSEKTRGRGKQGADQQGSVELWHRRTRRSGTSVEYRTDDPARPFNSLGGAVALGLRGVMWAPL